MKTKYDIKTNKVCKLLHIVFLHEKIQTINWKAYASKIKIFHNIKWDMHMIVFIEYIYLNK